MSYSLQTTEKGSMHRLYALTVPWPAAADEGSPRCISAPHIPPSPQTQSLAKPEVQCSSCPRLSCQPTWKAFRMTEIAAVPKGRGAHKLWEMDVSCSTGQGRSPQCDSQTWLKPRGDLRWQLERFITRHLQRAHISCWRLISHRWESHQGLCELGLPGMGLRWGRSFWGLGQPKSIQTGYLQTIHSWSNSECLSLAGISTSMLTAPLGSPLLSLFRQSELIISALNSQSKAKLCKTIFFFLEDNLPHQKPVLLTLGNCR